MFSHWCIASEMGGHPAAAIQLRSAIKRMYDYAIERRLVTINPATMVATRYIGKAVRRKRHLTSREIREFLQVVYQSNIRRQFTLGVTQKRPLVVT